MRYLLALAVAAFAAPVAAERITVTGEPIDTWCYFSGVMGGADAVQGTSHHTCALWCAAGGIPVGLLAEDGTVYMVLKIGDDDHMNGGDRLLEEIASHRIVATGDHYVRDGMNYIVVSEIVADQGIVNLTHEDYDVVPELRDSETEGVRRMKIIGLLLAAALIAPAGQVHAQAFSEGSEAKEWGLLGEEKARFSARVVDVLCELAGDCAASCGEGRRQLGLLREADGALILPSKNGQPLFTGAATDLQPWCGQEVEVDGVLVGDEDMTPAKFYMVQTIRAKDGGEPVKANRWTKVWEEEHPDLATQKGPWFRKDPRVNAVIAESGWLGLGLEEDAAYLEDYFE